MQDAIRDDQIIEGEYTDNPQGELSGKPDVEIPQSTKKRKKAVEPEPDEIEEKFEPGESSGPPATPDQIKSIHILAGKLWGKDFQKEYKEKLFTWKGKDSSKKLTSEEADNVIGLIVAELNANLKSKGKWKK